MKLGSTNKQQTKVMSHKEVNAWFNSHRVGEASASADTPTVYKPIQVFWGTLLGGPPASLLMWTINGKGFGQKEFCKHLLFFLLTLVLIYGLAWFTHSRIAPAGMGIVMSTLYARIKLSEYIQQQPDLQVQTPSVMTVIGCGIVGMLCLLAVTAVYVLGSEFFDTIIKPYLFS